MSSYHISSLKLPLLLAGLSLAGLSLSGCGSMGIKDASATNAAMDQGVLQQKDAEIAGLRNSLAEMQQSQTAAGATAGNELLPPNAKPGQCFARAFVPPTYKTETMQVLKSDASERIEVIPARYEMGQEQVLVKEASERLEVIPATYEWVEERVLVKEASERIETVPAQYKTVSEQILDKPEHTIWKKGSGPITKVDQSTGEIMCLVTVPATYKTITKQVLVSPAETRTVAIPAEYTTIKKRVLKTPARTETVSIPAEYKTVSMRKLADPAKTNTIAIPAKYETVTKQVQLTDGHIEWRPVLCQTNITPEVSMRIQRALQQAGFNPGPIDGVIGRDTMQAVEAYQRAKGLPRGGLTLNTIQSLGVEI